MVDYCCAKCGKPVALRGTLFERSCEHKDSPIVAQASATCKGQVKVG